VECCRCLSASPIRFNDILINIGDFSVSYRDFVVVTFGTLKCVMPAECILYLFCILCVCVCVCVCMEKSRHWEQSCKVLLKPNQTIKLNETTSWVRVICGTC